MSRPVTEQNHLNLYLQALTAPETGYRKRAKKGKASRKQGKKSKKI
jgi:hypothetical protein